MSLICFGLLKDLIEEGVDVDTRDQELMTPLMLAASGGYLDIVQSLIAAGVIISYSSVYLDCWSW